MTYMYSQLSTKISEAKKQTTTTLMVTNPAGYKKQNNLDIFQKHIKKIKKEKKKSFERKLSHPSRRRSA